MWRARVCHQLYLCSEQAAAAKSAPIKTLAYARADFTSCHLLLGSKKFLRGKDGPRNSSYQLCHHRRRATGGWDHGRTSKETVTVQRWYQKRYHGFLGLCVYLLEVPLRW